MNRKGVKLCRQLPPGPVKGRCGQERNRTLHLHGGIQEGVVTASFGQLAPDGLEHPFRVARLVEGAFQHHGGLPAVFGEGPNGEGAVFQGNGKPHVHFPYRFSGLDLPLKSGADIAVQAGSFLEACGLLAADGQALAHIGPEAGDAAAAVYEGKAVAVGENQSLGGRFQQKAVGPQGGHGAHVFPHGFGCIHAGPVSSFSV